MKIKEFIKSKYFSWVIVFFGELLLLFVVFSFGVFVGFRKANFSFKWGENYHRNFGGPSQGFLGGKTKPDDFLGRDFVDANGLAGPVIKIENNILQVKDKNGVEKTVLVDDKTSVRHNRDDLKITDIKIDDFVVVIGEPNDVGQINAKLIRIFNK